MSVGIRNQQGAIVVHGHLQANSEALLKVMAPSRDDRVSAAACLFTGYWLADRWAPEGSPFVLGHALARPAIQGGKANPAKLDAQKMAVLLRGGLLPQASGYPAERRAPRDLLWRRLALTRKRAERLTHVENPNSQDHVPAIGHTLASKANRDGVRERFSAPAVPTSIDGDLCLLDSYDQLLRALALHLLTAAKPHEAKPLSLLRTGPGIGNILRLVRL
jgi:hypothetical protein